MPHLDPVPLADVAEADIRERFERFERYRATRGFTPDGIKTRTARCSRPRSAPRSPCSAT